MRIAARKKSEGRSFNSEIQLTSLIDTYMCIIPFLLFSALFLKIAVINIALPGTADDLNKAIKNDKDKPSITLAIGISKEALLVSISGAKNFQQNFPMNKVNVNVTLQELHNYLLKIKEGYPDKTDIMVIPNADVKYSMIVDVLDVSRTINEKMDPEIIGRDENGNKVRLKRLFPDVVLGSVIQ